MTRKKTFKYILAAFALIGAIGGCVVAEIERQPAPATHRVEMPAPPADAQLIPFEEIKRDARGRIVRSSAVRAAFQRQVPCPEISARSPANDNGRRGRCPGFEIDHIVPLCLGGRDAVDNLQWLWDVEHDEVKTPKDLAACRALRRERRSPTGPGASASPP